MKKLAYIYLIAIVLLLVQCQDKVKPRIAHAWKMEGSKCIIELENVNYSLIEKGYWEFISDSIKGYSGKSAFIWKGKDNIYSEKLAYDAPRTNNPNKLFYEVLVDIEGDYSIYIRNVNATSTGNSVWLSVNNDEYVNFSDTIKDTWAWAIPQNIGNSFRLRKGINTIELVGRENGAVLDKMVIVNKDIPLEDWQNGDLAESSIYRSEKHDRKSPTTPMDLKATDISMSTVLLTWDESSDNEQIYCYHIFSSENGWINISYKNEYLVTGLKPSTEYGFFIMSTDLAGNNSDESETIKITTESFNPNDGTKITKLRIPPTIDGSIDGLWDDMEYHSISNVDKGEISNERDLSAKFKIAWDESYMYFLFNITDDVLITEDNVSEGIGIYLDMDNSKSPHLSINDRIYQFYLNKPKVDGRFYERTELINNTKSLKGIREERTLLSNGYIIECAFPWIALGIVPSIDEYIGLEIKVIDIDTLEETPAIITWYGDDENMLTSPYFYGTGKLEGNTIY